MAEATTVGRTRVSLIPDTSRFGTELAAELPKAVRPGALKAADVIGDTIQRRLDTMRPTVKIKADLDVTGIKERLDKLTTTRKIKLGIELDTGPAKTQLDRLAANRKVKLTVDVDDTSAKQKLDRLAGDRRMKVTAEADTVKAGQALDRLTRDRTVKVAVNVDETAARTKLNSILGQRTVDVLPKIQQAAYAAAERQLDRLCKDRVVQIRANVDTRVGAQEIRNLVRRQRVRIGIDVDTRVAADDIANLTRRRQMTVQARADTTAANTALNHVARDRTANVRVRSTGLAALTGALGNLGGGGGGGAGLSMLGGRIGQIAAASLLALPSIASLGQAIVQLGPLAATAAPALATLLGGFAAIKVGTTGIGDAIKAAFEPAPAAMSKAASSTRQVESAQRSLARAQRSLQDAQVQAAERVRQAQRAVGTAERELTAAQRDSRQAQLDLTAARREAVRELQDMNNQLIDGRLGEREAALAVQQAEEDLARTRNDPAATQLQIQQAELARDRAVQSLSEQRTEVTRLAKDTAAANKAGVEGSKTVVDAKRQVAQADQQVADRQRSLSEAQRGVVQAQVEGQRQIRDAQEAVADAARNVAQAQQTAATQTSALDTALSKLSPNARAFVGTLQAMAPAWRAMRLDVQDRLFAGLGTRLQTVGTQILPTVRRGLVGAAGALNTIAKNALTAVSNLQKAGTLTKVFDGIKSSLSNLSRVPGQLVTGFAQLSVAAQPAFDRMTSGLAGAMDKAMVKLDKAFKNGNLTKAINTALDVAIEFGKVLGDIGGIVKVIFKAAADAGGNFFGTIGAAIKEIRRVLEAPEMKAALTSIFKGLNAVAKLLAGALGAAIEAVLPVLAALAPTVVALGQILGPVINNLLKALGAALVPIAKALGPLLELAAVAIGKLVTALTPLLTIIGNLIAQALPLLTPLFTQWINSIVELSPLITLMATTLGVALKPVLNALVNLLVQVGVQMSRAFMDMVRQLLPVIPQLIPVIVQLAESIAQILIALTPLLPQILTLSTQFITYLLPAILPLIGPLTQLTLLLIQFATYVIVGIVVPALKRLVGYMGTLKEKFQPAVDAVSWLVGKISDFFSWLYDKLLGHSTIPDIVNGATRWFGDMLRRVTKIFTDLRDGASRLWNKLWDRVSSTAKDAWRSVRDGFGRFRDSLTKAFRNMRDDIGDIWGRIREPLKAPVRFWVNTVYNQGIKRVWDATASKLPGVRDLPRATLPKGFARGGVLPGWSTWRDGDDQLVPMRRGEGVYVSEAMRDPYERARLHAVNQAAMSGRSLSQFRGFSVGGVIGDITSGIKSGISKVFHAGTDAARGGLASLAEAGFKPIKSGLNKALGSNNKTWPGLVGGMPSLLIDKAIDYIRGKEAALGGSGRWMKPVNAAFGTRFGKRGSMWSSGRHTGLDFPARTGTKVVAVDSGTVTQSTTGGPYGTHVQISHGGGLSSLYAHMSAMIARAGQVIGRGDRVGSVGATGNVTGPHLHLEARKKGTPVDPMPYLQGGDVGGKGVSRWRGVVVQALGEVHQSLSLVTTTLRRMNQESGGNPNVVNTNDINWALGHPSVGLMQVIRGTFQAYAGKYKRTGPFKYGVSVDPLANIYASMRYALSRYGSLSRAYNRPGGYALGGIVGRQRINRGLPSGGYASGGVIRVGGRRISTGPIAASVGSDFLKQLSGTASAISTAMNKVVTALKNAFKGVKTTLDDKLIAQVKKQNTALQKLAKQRDDIKAQITAANTLATETTTQAVQFTALTSLPSAGNAFGAEGILAGLTNRLTQLKTFGKNLKTLAARGLNKDLLQQIITAGPEQGASYAQALVEATTAQLKDINTAQASISSVTTSFGKDAADALYDAGSQAGKGFLTGLTAQQKSIENQMSSLAKAIQKSIKKALKIKSPSRVFAEIGANTAQGFAQGVTEATPQASAAVLAMARTVRATAATTATRVQQQTSIRQGGERTLNYQATTREVASRQSVLDALALDEMLNRTVVT
ncbi:peptidoglycan DD-metalloendopeptidase family protein [Streptomyces sp. NPDC102364]|uniref:peptidoglycan DD-metalloendopeptidase family protein n=1 Tax=Streptomyces sp. NPDC102364 TaxID=3366161 RepID=UPI00381BD323